MDGPASAILVLKKQLVIHGVPMVSGNVEQIHWENQILGNVKPGRLKILELFRLKLSELHSFDFFLFLPICLQVVSPFQDHQNRN